MLVCMQTNHVSGLLLGHQWPEKKEVGLMELNATSRPCLALLTEVGAAKSGVFRSLNDPSLPLSSYLIRANPSLPDAAEL